MIDKYNGHEKCIPGKPCLKYEFISDASEDGNHVVTSKEIDEFLECVNYRPNKYFKKVKTSKNDHLEEFIVSRNGFDSITFSMKE